MFAQSSASMHRNRSLDLYCRKLYYLFRILQRLSFKKLIILKIWLKIFSLRLLASVCNTIMSIGKSLRQNYGAMLAPSKLRTFVHLSNIYSKFKNEHLTVSLIFYRPAIHGFLALGQLNSELKSKWKQTWQYAHRHTHKSLDAWIFESFFGIQKSW